MTDSIEAQTKTVTNLGTEQSKVTKEISKALSTQNSQQKDTNTTPHTIARKLTEKKIKTPAGRDTWSCTSMRNILSNEKYKGDALLQKTFCEDFLTKKMKINQGEVPQYYVENNHVAIIEPQTFDMVQAELARRTEGNNRHSGVTSFHTKSSAVTAADGTVPRYGTQTISSEGSSSNVTTSTKTKINTAPHLILMRIRSKNDSQSPSISC